MALHGDVRINGFPIIEWSARRTQELVTKDQVSIYHVKVEWLNWQTGEMTFRAQTFLDHKYSDLAEVLTAKVLTWASTVER